MIHKGDFEAFDESGKTYRVQIHEDTLSDETLLIIGNRCGGHRQLRLEDGKIVTRIEKGIYLILGTEIILKSQASNAP